MTTDKSATENLFLPGVPVEHVLRRLSRADGQEIESGKFASAESSAALAVNCFGWFIPRFELFPAFSVLPDVGKVELVDVEFCARFPWSGGKHPWLDAVVQSAGTLIGVESKRYEPFRDRKRINLSTAYDRDVWSSRMKRFENLRDLLRLGEIKFKHLDAAQLLKHAFGLVTEGRRRGRAPVPLYIYAEPSKRGGKQIDEKVIKAHRHETELFAELVAGDEVLFAHISYRDWLQSWRADVPELCAHRDAVLEHYAP